MKVEGVIAEVTARRERKKPPDLRRVPRADSSFDVRLDAGQIDNHVIESAGELDSKFLACLVAVVGAVFIACCELDVVYE